MLMDGSKFLADNEFTYDVIIITDSSVLAGDIGLLVRSIVMRDPLHELAIALSGTQALATSLPNTSAISLDVSSLSLAVHIAVHDLVISFIPYTHHLTAPPPSRAACTSPRGLHQPCHACAGTRRRGRRGYWCSVRWVWIRGSTICMEYIRV